MSNRRVLLIGSGQITKTLADLITNQPDFKLTILAEHKTHHFPENDVIYCRFDEDFSFAFKNIHHVIYAAETHPDEHHARKQLITRDAVIKAVHYAKQYNIQNLIFISSLLAFDPDQASDQYYAYMKKEADEYIMQSGLEYVILRPGKLNNEPGIGKVGTTDQYIQGSSITQQDLAWAVIESIKMHIANKTIGIIAGNTAIEQALRS